jgi:endo-chitodextinase
MKLIKFNKKNNLILTGKTYINTYLRFIGCNNITIEKSSFSGCKVYFIDCNNTRVIRNNFLHSSYNETNAHAVQFNNCRGGTISQNYFEEPVGASNLSDVINIYKSYGTKENYISIDTNYIFGGGPSLSGGGIMLGDNYGDFQVAKNNILISPGQYGIAIAGGNHNKILNNVVMSKQHNWTNVGIYIWGIPVRNSYVNDAVVEGNEVSWVNKSGIVNPWWQGSNTQNIIQQNNNFRATYFAPPKPDHIGI